MKSERTAGSLGLFFFFFCSKSCTWMFHTYLPTVDFSKLQPFTQMSSSISFTDHADVSNKCSEFIEMFLNLGRWCKSDFFREIYFILTMNNNCCAVRSFAEIFIIFPCSWHEWHLKNKEGDSWSKYYHGCMQVFFSKKNSFTENQEDYIFLTGLICDESTWNELILSGLWLLNCSFVQKRW